MSTLYSKRIHSRTIYTNKPFPISYHEKHILVLHITLKSYTAGYHICEQIPLWLHSIQLKSDYTVTYRAENS